MVIHPLDNVEIHDDGHKYARRLIKAGEDVIKYGMPIGHAVCDIPEGEHVHVHNIKTNLGDVLEYRYDEEEAKKAIHLFAEREAVIPTIKAYRHLDGRIGIRNDIWVIPTVGCVNNVAEKLAKEFDGVALTHPYGCSQLGDDHEMTAEMLASLARHPNAGGVLVVALGCENNTLESFVKRLGFDSSTFNSEEGTFKLEGGGETLLNIRFLKAQDALDEIEKGRVLIQKLLEDRPQVREDVPVSELVVGLKCGGSDGFSGLTANPLVGRFSDWLVRRGGSTVLTEVPEMFGAETLLMKRCRTREVFEKCVRMINDFKAYYTRHNQVIYENPSPGNKAGGISTLEDKSLGCVQKGGSSPVEDVLNYGESVKKKGLTLLTGPGNDLVASTVLAAAGCHIILFTTGRGTPFGTVVPTMKISTNTKLSEAKKRWIDWCAMADGDVEHFAEKVMSVASGEKACNELNGDRSIAIFKDGVTL